MKSHGPLATYRQYALQAQAKRGAVASEGHLDRFTGERLSLAIEQRSGGKRNAVPGELVVRLRPVKVLANFDITG